MGAHLARNSYWNPKLNQLPVLDDVRLLSTAPASLLEKAIAQPTTIPDVFAVTAYPDDLGPSSSLPKLG